VPRDRKGAQLALVLPPELIERLRARAASEGATATALARRYLEAGLSGDLAPAGVGLAGPDLSGLSERVGALEAEVAQLRRSASLDRVVSSPPAGGPEPLRVALGPGRLEILGTADLNPSAEGAEPSPEAPAIPRSGDAITTAELAEQTGTNRAGWNNWAKAERVGQVRAHPQAGRWRLVGRGAAPNGGPPRWLWQPA